MLLAFVIFYLFATVAIGWYASRWVKNTTDFALAGRKLPAFVVTSGLFATWFGSETVMGASSEFIEKGILGIIEDPFGTALCLILIGKFYAKPLYRLNILTFSDYFRIRFGRKSEWISAFFMIPSYFSWIAAQLVALGFILEVLSGIPINYGIVVCSTIVIFYTYIGGMWSISITDTIQTVIIIVGMLALGISIFNSVGGLDTINKTVSDDFWRFIPKENSSVSWLAYIAAWITIGLGSIPQQDVFQRVLGAKSENVAIKSSYYAAVMYLSIAILPLMIGLCGSILYPEILQKDTQMAIPMLVLKHASLPLQILTFGALLSAILSTCSGATLAPATVLAENLIKPILPFKLTDTQLLQLMRICVIVVAGISTGMALYKKEIYELVAESSALSLVALFIPLTAGLYYSKANEMGAILSMCLGTLTWTYFEFYPNQYPSLIWGLLASSAGMLVGGYLQPPIKKSSKY